MRQVATVLVGGAALLLAGVLSCGGGAPPPPKGAVAAPGGSKDPNNWPVDDKSMCDYRGKPELEVSETAGPGAYRPNVRRVYKTFGEGETRHKSLICREIDTNLDGIKDVVRNFNAKGEATKEEADTDYDGKIDVWMQFLEGRLSEEDIDTNHDGRPDVWKYYVDGEITRVKRDRNFDGKPDVWEIYTKGKLERMGLDDTFDGHVDRWDRDEGMRAEQDAAERAARDALAASQDAGPSSADVADAAPPPGAKKGAKKK